jgi:hypothetical protein
MKNYNSKNHYTFIMFLVVSTLFINGCGGDDGESATDRTNRLLKSGLWKLDRLTVDGVDKTNEYPGLTLLISEGIYTSTNGEPVWPISGTWNLLDEETLSRDNGETVHIDELKETNLILSLDWQTTTYDEGRIASIKGVHIFKFVK